MRALKFLYENYWHIDVVFSNMLFWTWIEFLATGSVSFLKVMLIQSLLAFYSCLSEKPLKPSSLLTLMWWDLTAGRVRKNENFPDSMIFVAKTFRIKRVNCVNFQIRTNAFLQDFVHKHGPNMLNIHFLNDLDTF